MLFSNYIFTRVLDSAQLIMSSLVIISIAITIISLINTLSSASPLNQGNAVLDFLNHRLRNDKFEIGIGNGHDSNEDDDDSSDSGEEVYSRHDALRTEDIAKIIKQVALGNGKQVQKGSVSNDHKQKINRAENYNLKHRSGKLNAKNIQNKLVEVLLSKRLNELTEPKAPRVTLTENRQRFDAAVSTTVDSDEKKDHINSLDKYSKIYIMLDPSAVSNSKNKQSLEGLISKLVSKSSLKQNEDNLRKKRLRYKGFVLNHNGRRGRRDSDEMYAPKDSMEDDYKPKRGRNAGGSGGGGGGAGGRTAIPYIRHRGDIYEKDN